MASLNNIIVIYKHLEQSPLSTS